MDVWFFVVIYQCFGLFVELLKQIKVVIKCVDWILVWLEVVQIVGFFQVEVDRLFFVFWFELLLGLVILLWFLVEIWIVYLVWFEELFL